MTDASLEKALQATPFIDADSQSIRAFAGAHAAKGSERERAIALYYAVRDGIRYDMRMFGLDTDIFVASKCLQAPAAFCVPKAITLAAVARASGIPARVGFADVKNHLTTPKMSQLMDTELFLWHAYTSLFIDGQWVKATPAFDIGLCDRHGVKPLEFDGRTDSIFHEFDTAGRRHMEYIRFHGEFDDMPIEIFSAEMRRSYPRMLETLARERAAEQAGRR